MIKEIVFDFEGPIWSRGDISVFEEISLRKGLDKDAFYNLAVEYFDGSHIGQFSDYADFYDKSSLRDFTLEEFTQTFLSQISTREVEQGTVGLINELKSKYEIGLFSNFGHDLIDFLKRLEVFDLFDHIVNSYDLKVEKPEAKAYEKMLEIIGKRAEEIVFIDDKQRNVDGAQAVGIQSILYTNNNQLKEDLGKIVDW